MKILILGAGGVGGYYGARLQEAGADVTWLVRPKRFEALKSGGLRVQSPYGDLALQPKLVTADTVTPDYDLVMIAPKAYDLADALASMAPAMQGRALLVPFLNGLAHFDQLDARFGPERVAGGVVHIAATLAPDGTVVQLTQLNSMTVGPRAPGQVAVLQALRESAAGAKFDFAYSEKIDEQLWSKWTFLATLAGATTLFRGATGKILETSEGAALVQEMYGECLAVASAYGWPVPAAAIERSLSVFLQKGSEFTASMYRDLVSGQRTEHEHVLGEMVRRAQAKGLPAPLMRAAWCHMQVEGRA
ncbi:MAG: ketopantoate reductase [Paucimonas sp.]|nr:ketopantoate reductase [Paucimonas sp.]